MDTTPGRGAIAFARRGDRSFVRSARATSPLKLLMPRNHGHAAWVVVASFGGGLVDGDTIAIDVEVEEGATGLFGTQASTKVYRCPTSACRQDTTARVAEGATLVMIPDAVACFAEARYEQTVRVDLAEGASIAIVDAFTAGRAARGERWDFHRYASRTEIARGEDPLFVDAIVLDPEQGDLHARMGRFDAFATIVIAGPRVEALIAASRDLPAPARRAEIAEASSPIADDAIVVRIAGASIEEVGRAVRRRLAGLGELLGDDPFARKW
jgi:urease accessory protein